MCFDGSTDHHCRMFLEDCLFLTEVAIANERTSTHQQRKLLVARCHLDRLGSAHLGAGQGELSAAASWRTGRQLWCGNGVHSSFPRKFQEIGRRR